MLPHLSGNPSTIHQRLRARDGRHAASSTEVAHLITAYAQVFDELTDTAPIIHIDCAA